jgi:hypothetical protein
VAGPFNRSSILSHYGIDDVAGTDFLCRGVVVGCSCRWFAHTLFRVTT